MNTCTCTEAGGGVEDVEVIKGGFGMEQEVSICGEDWREDTTGWRRLMEESEKQSWWDLVAGYISMGSCFRETG